jgi:hypothetical protein
MFIYVLIIDLLSHPLDTNAEHVNLYQRFYVRIAHYEVTRDTFNTFDHHKSLSHN